MSPIDDAWQTITSFRNLQRAAKRAARGKAGTAGVARFLFRMEPELLRLQRELQDGAWRPGVPFLFEIEDPKPRTIAAAPFRNRVVHHALIDPIEDALDRRLVDQTFACRRGKGQHRALRYAQRLVRKSEWFLKLDVKSFFPSLVHDVVMATLGTVIGDARALALCERIVRAGGDEGRGLPIGNLTSQWFANLVLGRLDGWLVEQVSALGYVRYMDDFVLFANDKHSLAQALVAIDAWLAAELRLRLKPTATILAPVTQGLPFLGFRVYRGMRRLRPENLRRTRARLRQRRHQLEAGEVDEQQYADSVRAVVAHLRHGNTMQLRRRLFAEGAARAAAGPFLRQPREPWRQLQRRAVERAVDQPQQEHTVDPQQQSGPAPREDVIPPDREDRFMASARSAP
jgi:hypothetical protein